MIPVLENGNPDNMHWYQYRHIIDSNGDQVIQRVHDGAFIPLTEDNGDYRRYLKFIENGNKPEEVDLRTQEGQDLNIKNASISSAWHKARYEEHMAARDAFNKQVEADRSDSNGQ